MTVTGKYAMLLAIVANKLYIDLLTVISMLNWYFYTNYMTHKGTESPQDKTSNINIDKK